MIEKLPSLAQLLKTLQHVPYLASKNIYRVSEYFLHMDRAKLEQFCAILLNAHEKVKQCAVCFCWQEESAQCPLCSDARRDQQTICVVANWQDVLAIEKTGGYKGVYHVLNGLICPLEGIGPEHLTLEALNARAVHNEAREIIIALNQTPEGEATGAFVANNLKNTGITITGLARGLPVGSSLEAMDRLTVFKALSERRQF